MWLFVGPKYSLCSLAPNLDTRTRNLSSSICVLISWLHFSQVKFKLFVMTRNLCFPSSCKLYQSWALTFYYLLNYVLSSLLVMEEKKKYTIYCISVLFHIILLFSLYCLELGNDCRCEYTYTPNTFSWWAFNVGCAKSRTLLDDKTQSSP